MTRAYQRLDPFFFERKALDQSYPAGAFVALVGAINLAESQPQRGRFRNRRVLVALLERYGRWVPELVRRGDLLELPDGRLYVDGWDEWQEGDWKVAERVARIRQRPHPHGTPGTVTGATAPTVTPRTVPTVSTPSDGGRQSGGVSVSGAVGGAAAVSLARETLGVVPGMTKRSGVEPIADVLTRLPVGSSGDAS